MFSPGDLWILDSESERLSLYLYQEEKHGSELLDEFNITFLLEPGTYVAVLVELSLKSIGGWKEYYYKILLTTPKGELCSGWICARTIADDAHKHSE